METPEFILQPESELTRKTHFVEGYRGIDFPEDPRFAAHNYVRSNSQEEILDLFSDSAREILRANEGTWVQGTGSACRFYEHGRKLPPKDIRKLIKKAIALVKAFEQAIAA
jgi:hypothetical protein